MVEAIVVFVTVSLLGPLGIWKSVGHWWIDDANLAASPVEACEQVLIEAKIAVSPHCDLAIRVLLKFPDRLTLAILHQEGDLRRNAELDAVNLIVMRCQSK
jgi:hypothetical protein